MVIGNKNQTVIRPNNTMSVSLTLIVVNVSLVPDSPGSRGKMIILVFVYTAIDHHSWRILSRRFSPFVTKCIQIFSADIVIRKFSIVLQPPIRSVDPVFRAKSGNHRFHYFDFTAAVWMQRWRRISLFIQAVYFALHCFTGRTYFGVLFRHPVLPAAALSCGRIIGVIFSFDQDHTTDCFRDKHFPSSFPFYHV